LKRSRAGQSPGHVRRTRNGKRETRTKEELKKNNQKKGKRERSSYGSFCGTVDDEIKKAEVKKAQTMRNKLGQLGWSKREKGRRAEKRGRSVRSLADRNMISIQVPRKKRGRDEVRISRLRGNYF